MNRISTWIRFIICFFELSDLAYLLLIVSLMADLHFISHLWSFITALNAGEKYFKSNYNILRIWMFVVAVFKIFIGFRDNNRHKLFIEIFRKYLFVFFFMFTSKLTCGLYYNRLLLFWSILVPAARFDWLIPLVWSRLLFYFSHRFNLYWPISSYTYLVIFSTLPKLYFSSTCRSVRPFHLPYTLSLTLSDRIRFRINRSKKKKENFVAAKHVLWNIHEDLTKEWFQRNEGEMISLLISKKETLDFPILRSSKKNRC